MIELKNISGGYGSRRIISDVSLAFPRGKITSIIGANGCGKSTLLMICAGLLTAFEGEIFLDGKNFAEFSRKKLAQCISYLGQIKSAGAITVRSLVAHGRFPYLGYPRKCTKEDNEKIDEAMKLAGISDLSERLLSELSGGQQQRAHIAMTLAQDTDVILLDEPLTYLDISRQFELMELILKLKALGKTVIMVMHDLNFALSYSDMIAVMENGKITEFGFPKEIAQSGALVSALGINASFCEEARQYFFTAR